MTGEILTEQELRERGRSLGRALPPGSVVFVEGELGAGKTTLVQAMAEGLGVMVTATSPTYNLVHQYQGTRGPVFHLDCYRLKHPGEAQDLDWETLLADGDAVLVEWPERAAGWIPEPTLRCRLAYLPDDPTRRRLEVA